MIQISDLQKDEIIYTEGDIANEIYIIKKG